MREVIEQILDGTYDYEKGALDFSCAKLEIELQKGENYEGSFKIFASEGKYTVGYVTSSDPRMECLTPEFSGNEEEISFRFHGEWMEEGEVTKGEFYIVSNKGEYYLPYVVSVEYTVPQSSIGPIKNLFHFANLAKSNWQEAVHLFYSPAFAHVIQSGDRQVALCYQGLSVSEGNEQNVEEFLIAMNKKQKVEYLVSEESLKLENPQGIVETALNIFRNGWGYTWLEIQTEGEFLFVEKKVLTEDDFLGNRCVLPVYVEESLLHAGKNLGVVKLRNAYTTIRIPVEVVRRRKENLEYACHVEKEKNIGKLMELYQGFRLKKINTSSWLKETTKLIERMLALDEKDATIRLFQAHLLITREQYNEAGWVLEHIGELLGEEVSPALEAYYLYLNTLYKKEEGYTAEISWQVTKLYKECGEDWRVAWLLLFLVAEYNRNPASKWAFLARQFENGSRSPLIYMEALFLVNTNPTLLRKLGKFELQVLNYGRKKASIHAEVLEQVLYLSERVKDCNPLLFTILKGCYEHKKDIRVLKEICTLLIKGNRAGKKYFEWFAKGVDEELRITNLYEYYMLSMDLSEEPDIPKRVLLYFTYQTNLDYLHNAYLFYYVAKHEREFPDIFENYRPRMEVFAREQIGKGHINRHLAYLYKLYLEHTPMEESLAEPLSKLIFAHEIQMEREGIRSVIVCQPEHLREMVYPVVGDKVWIPLYGSEYCILFENQQGNRLIKDVPHTTEKLMSASRLVDGIAGFVTTNLALDIYLQEHMRDGVETSTIEQQRWLRILEYPYVSERTKSEIILKVAHFYYNNDDKKHLAEYVCAVNGDGLTAAQRAEILRYMVLSEQFEKAYEWLGIYGADSVDDKICLRLLDVVIDRKGYAYEKELLGLTYALFERNKYSSTTIQYLMQYYQGMVRDLRKIWKASKSYSMDRGAFCEKILIQMLFSGCFIGEQAEIFQEYVQGRPDKRVEEAYLAKSCYDFFVKDKLIPKEVLAEVSRLQEEEHPVLKICKLAYLKCFAEYKVEIRQEEAHIIREFLENMLQEGIHLNCFLELRKFSKKAMRLVDKTIIEYHASPESQPRIHYLIMKENGDAGEYLTEYMDNAIGSVFFKEFVLFWGESLQYYIVEERGGEEKLTQSGMCQRNESQGEDSAGRYGALNDIVMSKTLEEYDTLDTLLEEYYKRDFYNQALFELRK